MPFAGVSIAGNGETIGHVINVTTNRGYHLLVVNGFSRTRGTKRKRRSIRSLPFMVGGHRWCISYYPNGTRSACAGWASLYLVLVDENIGEALKVQYVFSFIDELDKQESGCIRAKTPSSFSSCNLSWGYTDFMKKDALEERYVSDGCLTIRCDLNIATTVDLFIKVPPCSIHQHISDLLVSKEGTDVTFKVEGETFAAHRCVLAARSAVFKTELFGTMKEGTISSIIHVEDMEAKVFGALLSFIYTDSLPRMEVDMVEEGQVEEALWLQHLLAAADRYDLRRLKVLCEEKLCEHIDMSSVTTILTLAEQHNCRGLKEVCFEFLKTPANLKAITAVDGLEDITRTCPSLLKELITKLAS